MPIKGQLVVSHVIIEGHGHEGKHYIQEMSKENRSLVWGLELFSLVVVDMSSVEKDALVQCF